MKKCLTILIILLIIPLVYPCTVDYDIEKNVIIYDAIEQYGEGANCTIRLYYEGNLLQLENMTRNGLSYEYNAGRLHEGIYTSGIECNLSNSSFISECKFEVSEGDTMNIYDIMFMLQFLILVGITIVKLYSVMKQATLYNFKTSIVLFIVYLVAWLVGLVALMYYPEKLIYRTLFTLGSWLMVLNVVFFVIELFYSISKTAVKPIEAYKPIR